MNINPSAMRILCFGDSNTWGRSGASADRYPLDVRWTGLMQTILGEKFEVIEEGLRSRTSDIDDNDSANASRNGKWYLRACLESHNPIDAVVLWLGSNDLKSKFNRTAVEISESVEGLVELIHDWGINRYNQPSTVLLISPPLIREEYLKPGSQFVGAGIKSAQLGVLFEKIAKTHSCVHVNMAQYVQAGTFDGVHLERESQPIVAKLIANKLFDLPFGK